MIPENGIPDSTLIEGYHSRLLTLASADMSGHLNHLNHQGSFSGVQTPLREDTIGKTSDLERGEPVRHEI